MLSDNTIRVDVTVGPSACHAAAKFTGDSRPLTGVFADDDKWHNDTNRNALVQVDGAAIVTKDAESYTATYKDGKIGDGGGAWSAGATFATVLVLVPPSFYLLLDSRSGDTYPTALL